MKKIFTLFILLSFVCLSFAQQKWHLDKRLTPKPPLGTYNPLPGNNLYWENNNHSSRIYQTPEGSLVIGPNFRVLPNSNQQDEVILKTSPVNTLIMFGSSNTTVGANYGEGAYITTNGGNSWSGTDIIPSYTFSPSDPGPTIDKNGTIIMTTLNIDQQNSPVVSTYSTNNGATWSSALNITSTASDKNFAASDDVSSSAFYGRSYCVWSNFSANDPPVDIAYTTNGGVSWSSVIQVNTPPANHYSTGVDIAIGVNGEVYSCWAQVLNSNLIEDFLGFGKSTNGGTTWVVTDNAFDMNGIRATTFNGWNFRVNSFPRIAIDRTNGPRHGWIYVVASQVNLAPAGTDCDVVMHRSTDGGATWSSGIRVNQDALNNGKVQFFPAICVDGAGGVDICYYDNRNYPSVGDSCETYMSHSPDGGNTWVDFPVSDHRWKVDGETGLQPYGGDYIGVSVSNNRVFPFWMDNKSGSMQAWTCAIDVNAIGITPVSNNVPANYSLEQNYPNPFNPATNIKFDVPKSGHVMLAVYDMLGNRVELIVNNELHAGSYTADFHANNLASGVYFYRLEAGDFVQTKKMILVK